ncbi:MAG TPA: DNRLRE domain-containing protein [Verrucomicrobiae bacterium]|nr:DNRLRE domain-containing protein [Verrucomicrobiae bacterium]
MLNSKMGLFCGKALSRGFLKTISLALVMAAGGVVLHATPVFHGVSAADVTVVQKSTSTSSTSAVAVSTSLSINNFNIGNGSKRGLFVVQIGSSTSSNVQNGILISCIDQNGRNNNEGANSAFPGTTYGSSAVAGSVGSQTAAPGATGIWTVPEYGNAEPVTATNITSATNGLGVVTYTTNYVHDTASYAYTTYNFNFAAGYFPYSAGWYGGWVINTTNGNNLVVTNIASDTFIGNTNLVLGTNIIPWGAAGAVTVDLRQFGLNTNNALILAAGGKAEENFADSKPVADGTWIVSCRDDQSGGTENDPVAFVCIPMSNTNVIAGRFAANLNAANDQCIVQMANAPFSATHIGAGTYFLTIPGVNPNSGVLVIANDEDGPNNPDNLVSYSVTNGGWVIQTRDTGDNQTPNLQNFTQGDTIINFVFIPAPTPGITVTPTNGLATSEDGNTASFTVTLDSPPAAEVDLNMNVSDPGAAVLSAGTLVFEPTNWNIPQTVTVTGVDNDASSPENYTVTFEPASSTDTNFAGLQAPSVALVNIPTGTPGIFLVPATGLTTTGAGGTATFQAIMNLPPTDNVTVSFHSSDTTQGTVSPASITFTPSNWSTSQVVTVTGQDDGIVDGDIAYQINSDPAVSSDSQYNGYNAGSVSVVNLENDAASVNISCGSAVSVLEGFTTNISITLSAKPVSNVTIGFASSDTTLGTVSPAQVTFTPGNWNVPQTVTLTGVANASNQGSASYALTVTVTSANFGYDTLTVPDITAATVKPIGFVSGTAVYGLGMPSIGVDGQAIASDAINFSGATLAFSLTANADSTDVLGIRNDSTGVGIGVSGHNISDGGNPIATFTGGSNGAPLVVTVQSGVIGDMVADLIRSVTFSSATTNDFSPRTLQLSFNAGVSVVTKSIRVGQLRITEYQNGLDYGYGTYSGQMNDELAETNGSGFPAGSSAANGLYVSVDANLANQHQVLLQFDDLIGTNAGQIPVGSTIVAADVSVNIQKSGDGWAFSRMQVPWTTNASWDSFPPYFYGVYLDTTDNDPNALLDYQSQMGNYILVTNADESVSDSETAIADGYVSAGVTPDVQAWANGETNYGWVLIASTPWGVQDDLTTGTGFTPGQDPRVSLRPRLRVFWLPPGTASASFQDGFNNYTNSHDTEITQSTPNNNNVKGLTMWSDGADLGQAPDATEALLRFDDIIGNTTNEIPPGAHIEVAMLNLSCLNSKDCVGNGGQFFALLQPWDDTTTTWNSWDPDGNGILNDGVEAAADATVTAGIFTLTATGKVPGGYHSFEVTPDVQNWANGTSPNYGWGIIPWLNGSDGWGINTSKDPNTNSHPQLVVYYTLPVGFAARPTIMPLTVSESQVQVSFSGTVGTAYTVWRTDRLGGTWTSLGTATVQQNGVATYVDTNPLPGTAFYRVTH